jgi:integrase
MSNRQAWGGGGVTQLGEDIYRLRYRVNGKRYSVTFRGKKTDAYKELRRLLHDADSGKHVEPHQKTVRDWIEHWLSIGAPGKRQKRPSARTLERYSQLLRTHVLPTLGDSRLQKLTSSQIDNLYTALAAKIAPRTCHHVHVVLGSALGAAVRARELVVNPMAHLLNVPSPGEADHGVALNENELRNLVDAFRGSAIFPIVAVAAYTGMRRNEVLALRWSDFEAGDKALHVRRAIEQTKTGITFKPPKTKRGLRAIAIDDDLTALLCGERDKYLRLIAGVPDGAAVDLSLVRLPDDALIFPSPVGPELDLTQARDPHAVSRAFAPRARKLLGFRFRFHDLRGSHGSALIRRGVAPDLVARRLGHDPATMWRSYIKTLKGDDASTLNAIAAMSLGGRGRNT